MAYYSLIPCLIQRADIKLVDLTKNVTKTLILPMTQNSKLSLKL